MCVHKELQNKIHNSSVVDLVSYPEQFSNVLTLITSSDFLFLIVKKSSETRSLSLLYHLCVRGEVSHCFLDFRSLAATSQSPSSLLICEVAHWTGPPRTSRARNMSSRYQIRQSCCQVSLYLVTFNMVFW